MGKKQETLVSINMDSFLSVDDLQNSNSETLHHVLKIMESMVAWLIQSGIGYNEFSAALKPVFFNQAIKELETLQQKKTDSSLSLLSGLNRRDISSLRQHYGEHIHIRAITNDLLATSVPARVIGLWLSSKLPYSIPFSEFEDLVSSISSEKHPRSILSELKRLRLASENENIVILNTNSYTPSPETKEAKELLTSNVRDHLNAGLQNVVSNQDLFLEQAVFADELTEKSIQSLKQLSHELWQDYSLKILSKAAECCKEDEGRRDAVNFFKLGIYQFDNFTLTNRETF